MDTRVGVDHPFTNIISLYHHHHVSYSIKPPFVRCASVVGCSHRAFLGIFSLQLHITQHSKLNIDFSPAPSSSSAHLLLPLLSIPSQFRLLRFPSICSPPSFHLHPFTLIFSTPGTLHSIERSASNHFCLSFSFLCFCIPCAVSQQQRPAMSTICGYLRVRTYVCVCVQVCKRACVHIPRQKGQQTHGIKAQTISAGQQTVFFHWC